MSRPQDNFPYFPAPEPGGGDFGTFPPARPEAGPNGPTDGAAFEGGEMARPVRAEGGLPSAAELEQTLQRLMRRVSMLVQAEK
ncbi:hypothetical protein EON80_07745, partial [bacterium]